MSGEPARTWRGGGESLDLLSLARAGQAGTVADSTPEPRPRPSAGGAGGAGGGGDARAGGNGAWDVAFGAGVAWEGVSQRPVPATLDSPGDCWG